MSDEQLKSRIDFAEPPEEAAQPALREAQAFAADEQSFAALTEDDGDLLPESAGERAVEQALQPRRSLWRKLVLAGGALLGISAAAQTGQWLYDAWLTRDWIALGCGGACTLLVVAALGALGSEWRRLWHLRTRAEARETGRALLQSHEMGRGRDFCQKLAQQAGLDSGHPALQRWHASLHDTHSDRDTVRLYAQLVQPVQDRQARREIGRHAAESTLMIAVSPLALVDMAFIAWRNLRLVNRIAAIYGIELGYFSRIRLFRLVLLNMAFAGASELVREVGMDWMSQDIAARLSTRAAQGIGAGLLTARLGIKTMELCRPLPWLEEDKPRLGDFRRDLLRQLRQKR